jgi:hypothetical protein
MKTESIIPNSSIPSYEHKMSDINYLFNRLHTYPLAEKAKDAEMNNIKNILLNNEYGTSLIRKLPPQKEKQNTHTDSPDQKTKWITSTYSGKEARIITKLFQDTKLKVAFCTQNTIQNIVRPQPQINKYNRSGIYQMKCLDCPVEYVGQTERTLNPRYMEHIYDIKSNNSSTGYSSHILNTGYTCVTIEDTMEIIKIRRKGQYLNTLKKYILKSVDCITLSPAHIKNESLKMKTTEVKYSAQMSMTPLMRGTRILYSYECNDF